MAYSTLSPPSIFQQNIAGERAWFHTSADDSTAVDVSGFITNGGALGMKVGDIVYHKGSTTKKDPRRA